MKCPVCTNVDLLIAERQGVEIDYCPQCRGVWLDRGELDKVIERSSVAPIQHPLAGMVSQHSEPQYPSSQVKHGHDDHHGHKQHGYGYGHQKKKKSFLSEIFDFD